MAESGDDRWLAASLRRRQQARAKGHVATSGELSASLLSVGSLLAFLVVGGAVVRYLAQTMQAHLGGDSWRELGTAAAVELWHQHVARAAATVLPIFAVCLGLTVAAQLAQVGFLFVPQRVLPDVHRINPVRGLQQIVSADSAVRLLQALVRVSVVGAAGTWLLWSERDTWAGLSLLEFELLVSEAPRYLMVTTLKIWLLALALGGLDYAYQRWRYERTLMMTAIEAREELKAIDGDPQVVDNRRKVHRRLSGRNQQQR